MEDVASDMTGSVLEYMPVINELEAGFKHKLARQWMNTTFYTVPFIGAAAYLIVVYFGRQYMKPRVAYDLKRWLFLWNVGLAFFSFCGSIALAPHLVHAITRHGVNYTTCKSEIKYNPHIMLWGFFFCLSKLMELGDTVFIILRKAQLNFLHWYHHLSVLFFAYFTFSRPIVSAVEHYFCCINFLVHTVMYSYYALKAAGVRISSRIAFVITVLQIVQMFTCVYVTCLAYYNHRNGVDCELDVGVFYFSLAMYASYAVLFINYFIKRYI